VQASYRPDVVVEVGREEKGEGPWLSCGPGKKKKKGRKKIRLARRTEDPVPSIGRIAEKKGEEKRRKGKPADRPAIESLTLPFLKRCKEREGERCPLLFLPEKGGKEKKETPLVLVLPIGGGSPPFLRF